MGFKGHLSPTRRIPARQRSLSASWGSTQPLAAHGSTPLTAKPQLPSSRSAKGCFISLVADFSEVQRVKILYRPSRYTNQIKASSRSAICRMAGRSWGRRPPSGFRTTQSAWSLCDQAGDRAATELAKLDGATLKGPFLAVATRFNQSSVPRENSELHRSQLDVMSVRAI